MTPPTPVSALASANLTVAEAVDDVIVDHADGLHVRVNDGRAHEAEPALLHVTADLVGERRARRDLLHALVPIHDRLTVDEAPLVRVESAELFLHLQERARILHGRLDL